MGVAIYLVIGVPASGKSWVCEQLTAQFEYAPHDAYISGTSKTNSYIAAIVRAHKVATKPLLIETPFSVSQIKEPLEAHGYNVVSVFIIEDDKTLEERYKARERKPIPLGHLTRQRTYKDRALTTQAFYGTSDAVLAYLKNAAPQAKDKLPWE